jgi:hypothetical protein
MPDFSLVIDLLTLLAIVTGVVFGLAEIRSAKISRQDEAAIAIISSAMLAGDIEAVKSIYQLPFDAPPESIVGNSQVENAAQLISNQTGAWGILVHQGKIELHTVDLMVGGLVRGAWKRLRKYIEFQRSNYSSVNYGEWFQWLAEQLENSPASGKPEGVHVSFRHWKP